MTANPSSSRRLRPRPVVTVVCPVERHDKTGPNARPLAAEAALEYPLVPPLRGLFTLAAAALFQEPAEILILPPGRLQIKRLILDADPEIVQ